MDAVQAGGADGLSRTELADEMMLIEQDLRKRLPVGWSTSYQAIVKEFVSNKNYSQHALERTLYVMEKREIIRFSSHVSLSSTSTDRCSSLSVEKNGASGRGITPF